MGALLSSFLCLSLLVGCSPPTPQHKLEDYQQRMSRALQETLPDPETGPRLLHLPRYQALQIELTGGSLGTLDFMALSGCKLQITIGKRNSSLGKFARPSQRLLLDLEFLRLAPACIAHLREKQKSSLAKLLEQEVARKQAQLPARIFNATVGGEEFRSLWKPTPVTGEYPRGDNASLLQSLALINSDTTRWIGGDYAADGSDFELALSVVSGGDGGELLQALLLQQRELDRVNRMINSRINAGALCTPNRQPQSAAITGNVVRRFFLGEVQPWSAALGRRYHQLLPLIRQLEDRLNRVLPEAYRQWQASRKHTLSKATAAPSHHVTLVAHLLRNCHVFPGQ